MADTVEISANELAQYKAALDALNRMEATDKSALEALVKKSYPDKKITTTEDIAKPFVEPIKKELDALREWKSTIEKNQKEWEREEKFRTLKSKHGVTDEGEKAIRKLMEEEKIENPEAAIALWEKRHPSVTQTVRGSLPEAGFENNIAPADQIKEIMKPGWEDRETNKILAEMRAGNE